MDTWPQPAAAPRSGPGPTSTTNTRTPPNRAGFQCDRYRTVRAAGTNQVLAKFADSLDWTKLAFIDIVECCCQHAGRNDATPHADGSLCRTGTSVCIRCAESWSWDYQLRYGPPVRITTTRAAVIKTQRVDQGIAWADLASTTGIPHGTISSIGYAPQNMHPFELRLLTHALHMPTQHVLDIRDL